jgi:Arc/MetJ-type ribon-helix-helix transcriptional regulator
MARTTVRLSEQQAQQVRALAAQRGVSMAEIIRESIDAFAAASQRPSGQELRERSSLAIGIGRSGLGDLATNHDAYLAEAYDQ